MISWPMFFFLSISLLPFALALKDRLTWLPSLLWFWACVTGLLAYSQRYGFLSNLDQGALASQAGLSVIALLTIPLTLAYLPVVKLETLIRGFGYLGLLNTVLIVGWAAAEIEPDYRVGIFNNPSLAASFSVMTLPWLLTKRNWSTKSLCLFRWFAVYLTALAVGLTHSAMGILSLAGMFLWWARGYLRSITAAGIFSGVLIVPIYYQPLARFFSDSGRVEVWRFHWKHWIERFNPMIGSGLGTFKLFGPALQQNHNFMAGSWFIDLHSDYVQMGYELGAVGLALAIAVIIGAIRRARGIKCPYLMPALIGTMICSAGNTLTVYPLHAIYWLCLLVIAYRTEISG